MPATNPSSLTSPPSTQYMVESTHHSHGSHGSGPICFFLLCCALNKKLKNASVSSSIEFYLMSFQIKTFTLILIQIFPRIMITSELLPSSICYANYFYMHLQPDLLSKQTLYVFKMYIKLRISKSQLIIVSKSTHSGWMATHCRTQTRDKNLPSSLYLIKYKLSLFQMVPPDLSNTVHS